MVVMKFGGTSVENALALRRMAEIVADRKDEAPVVVVSAMAGVTNQLVELAEMAMEGERGAIDSVLQSLADRHVETGREIQAPGTDAGTANEIQALCAELRDLLHGIRAVGELTPRSRDAVLSYGELLSSQLARAALMARGLSAVLVDARQIILTDRQFTRAQPQEEAIQHRVDEALLPLLASSHPRIPVLGGFIGAAEDGTTTTLGRGGSDFSAALIGAALNADRIEIWTDVDGILTTDPRLCPQARRVKVMSFAEAAESAYFGAKVLHPSTLLPAMAKNIPVWVLNSRAWIAGPPLGDRTGTLVTLRAPRSRSLFKCISCKRGIAVVDVVSTRMLMAHGFMQAIFEVFARHACPVDMLATSEVSVSLTVGDTSRLPAIADDLGKFAQVRYEGRMAILCMVGESIRYRPGVAAHVFTALRDINIRMISQGASEINIGVVIADDDVPAAVTRLHEAFFQDLDPDIFDIRGRHEV